MHDGKLKLLAVAAPRRVRAFPNAPSSPSRVCRR